MALRKVRSNIDRLFDKSLTDLIRGIRNNKDNEVRLLFVSTVFFYQKGNAVPVKPPFSRLLKEYRRKFTDEY